MEDSNDTLKQVTEQFLRSTTGLKYPQALVNQFPRIANELMALKNESEKLRHYFVTLTEDQRGNRKGFSFEVLMEIHHLREVMLGDVNAFELNDTNKWVS